MLHRVGLYAAIEMDLVGGRRLIELKGFKCKVSSTQEGSGNFSKQHMFDENEDTCWYSKPGPNQWIVLAFDKPVVLAEIRIMFQGGFVGTTTVIEGEQPQFSWSPLCEAFHLEDGNALQVLSIPPDRDRPAHQIYRIRFLTSSDLYGRITIYKLQVFAYE